MARKRKTTFRRKRRFQTKRKRGKINQSPAIINTHSTLGPDAIMVKLPYYQDFTDSTGTFAISQQFRMNSLFDPDLTGGGHQPMGFDQWAGLYQSYTVLGAMVSINAVNTSGTAEMIITPNNSTTGASTADEQREMKWSRSFYIPANQQVKVFNQYYDIKKLQGIRDMVGDDQYRTDITTNPGDTQALQISTRHIDGSTAIGLSYRVKILFYCYFSDLSLRDGS